MLGVLPAEKCYGRKRMEADKQLVDAYLKIVKRRQELREEDRKLKEALKNFKPQMNTFLRQLPEKCLPVQPTSDEEVNMYGSRGMVKFSKRTKYEPVNEAMLATYLVPYYGSHFSSRTEEENMTFAKDTAAYLWRSRKKEEYVTIERTFARKRKRVA